MKIKGLRKQNVVNWCEIKVGETFIFNDEVYMKTKYKETEYPYCEKINCICLNDGEFDYFENESFLEVVDGEFNIFN